jgi:hypothetical protein
MRIAEPRWALGSWPQLCVSAGPLENLWVIRSTAIEILSFSASPRRHSLWLPTTDVQNGYCNAPRRTHCNSAIRFQPMVRHVETPTSVDMGAHRPVRRLGFYQVPGSARWRHGGVWNATPTRGQVAPAPALRGVRLMRAPGPAAGWVAAAEACGTAVLLAISLFAHIGGR